MKKLFCFVFLLVMTSCTKESKDKLPIAPQQEFDSVRKEIIDLVKSGKTPSFSIAVLQNGNIVWREAFEKGKDSSIVITSNGQYPIASLTKSMTAYVMLKLVEEEKVSLDDKISQFLSNTFIDFGNTTVKNLLTMTAGIPHGGISVKSESHFFSLNNDSLIKNVYGMKVFPKGTFEYSNISYGLLEAIIEKICNKPYNMALEEKLFSPLGMTNSFVEPNSIKTLKNGANVNDQLFSSKFYPSGGAGVYSTLEDLIKYAKLNLKELNESIIAHKTLDVLHNEKTNPSSIIALGWGSIKFPDGESWMLSNGSFPLSANSHLTILPEQYIAVICLANRDYNSMADIIAIKTIDVLLNGFADKAFAFMESYEQEKSRPFILDYNAYTEWEGALKSSNFEIPIKFRLISEELEVSVDNSQWQPIENVSMDNQSLIRGHISLSLVNPLTKTQEDTSGNINLLINNDQLEGYYLASIPNSDFVFLELPFYIKVKVKETEK